MTNVAPRACHEYESLSRRMFLRSAGAVAAAAATAPAWMPRVALARSHRSMRRDVMVCIFLRGAIDGLSVCVPYAEPAYYTARPTLALPPPGSGPNAVTDLDGFFGLAPGMMPLHHAYTEGRLLFVQACGSHDPSRSHFEAQRFMEAGRPRAPELNSGWIARHLLTSPPGVDGATVRALALNANVPFSLYGAPDTLPVEDATTAGLAGYPVTMPERLAALQAMYSPASDPTAPIALDTFETMQLLQQINVGGYAPSGGAVYPTTNIGRALRSAAALIKAEAGVEILTIDMGGWDTHEGQGPINGYMHNLMLQLSTAIAAFDTDMNAGSAPSFTLVAMSEFGRNVPENASLGTDHGHGNCMLVLGQAVFGGRVLTIWPGMQPEQLDMGTDLQVTIDYRDILSEILTRRIGRPNVEGIFPGFTPTPRPVFSL